MKPLLLASCGLALFGAGIGVGWVSSTPPDDGTTPPQAAAETPQPRRRTNAPENSRRTELKRLAADTELLRTKIDSLPEADIPELIDQLSARAGIEGLDWQARSDISSLVKRLYAASPEKALAWIRGTTHEANRKYFFECALEFAASKDPLQALELAESFCQETGDTISPSSGLCQALADKGADNLLRALDLGAGHRNGTSSSKIDFPKDFDFARFAEGIAKTASDMAEGEQFSYMPSNFLERWTSLDPQAAYEWALAADTELRPGTIPFARGLPGFFDGYSKIAEPSQYGKFAAEATMSGDLTERSWRNAYSALSANLDSVAIDAFFAEASAHRDSNEIIRGLLDISRNFSGGSYDQLRNRMLRRLPDDQRAAYIRDAPESLRARLDPGSTD